MAGADMHSLTTHLAVWILCSRSSSQPLAILNDIPKVDMPSLGTVAENRPVLRITDCPDSHTTRFAIARTF